MVPGRKRSQTGCETCRARKVKCDERPNGCLNCQRLQLECLRRLDASPNQNDGSLVGAAASSSLRRRRLIRSCKACRASKLRCSGTPPCENCQRRGLCCQHESGPEPVWMSRTKSARLPQAMPPPPPPGDQSQSCSPSYDKSEPAETISLASSKNANASATKSHWLFAHQLPKQPKLSQLVELYFQLVHPLRCFSFIHRPSFIQHMEDQSEGERNSNVVLLAVCAIAAKFYAAERLDELGDGHVLEAGNEWAQMAHRHLYDAVQTPSTGMIMAAVLLHEHALRVGNYASAFVITGLAVRLAQALRLNLEQQGIRGHADARPCTLESCRRLMWSVYIMDAWVGSGVEELTLLDEKHLKIELPVSEMDFVLENTKMPSGNPSTPEARNLDLEAHFVTLVGIRRRVLWTIKNLHAMQDPWLAQSEWSLVRSELFRWHQALPGNLGLTRSAIQTRKISGQHGALLHLHLTYHQTLYDLTRIGMPGLMRIKTPFVFPPEQGDFVRGLQDQCFEHGLAVSAVFDEALRHGMEAFADTWLCVVAHDVSRMLIHFLVNKFGSRLRQDEASLANEVQAAVKANAGALHRMVHMMALARPLLDAVITDLEVNGLEVPPDLVRIFHRADTTARASAMPLANSSSQGHWGAGTLAQQTPENVLAPLAIFRMARKDIAENRVHARPKDISDSAPLDRSPGGTEVAAAAARQQPCTWMQLTSQRPSTMSHAADNESECMAPPIEFCQLPMGFDDLQLYMTGPLMIDGYLERAIQGSNIDGDGSFTTAYWPNW